MFNSNVRQVKVIAAQCGWKITTKEALKCIHKCGMDYFEIKFYFGN